MEVQELEREQQPRQHQLSIHGKSSYAKATTTTTTTATTTTTTEATTTTVTDSTTTTTEAESGAIVTQAPILLPTQLPTRLPTPPPTRYPTRFPTRFPTPVPSLILSADPTERPTTSEPTTSEPTTSEPTTSEPTTSEPTTSEPTTSEPTTSEPTTDTPTSFDRAIERANAEKMEYDSHFESKPVTQNPTLYSLFSNPRRFSIDYIHHSTHYLTDTIDGNLWLDVNGDGDRGDYANSTIHTTEYDHGIGGVRVHLVHCETDEFVSSRVTRSVGPEGKSAQGAGSYSFDLHTIKPGRYYLVYQAPFNYRISGNVLPLERDFPSFDCVPKGGEGEDYIKEAREKGDLDFRGYCARSIGCFQVDSINPHKKSNFDDFSKLFLLENSDNEVSSDSPGRGGGGVNDAANHFKHGGNLAALPSADFMNVGLAREGWELPAYQYTDVQVVLTFPSDVAPIDLYRSVPEDFERSAVRAQLEDSLADFLGRTDTGPVFSISGVTLHSGKVDVRQRNPQNGELEASEWPDDFSKRRLLRGTISSSPRRLHATGRTSKELIYTMTTRGSYRPPPHDELGSVVVDSINANPQRLIKCLEDKEELPEVFDTVDDVYARRLTVKEGGVEAVPTNVKATMSKVIVIDAESNQDWISILGMDSWGMERWAAIPVLVLAGLITILIALFMLRRAFVRRVKKGSECRPRMPKKRSRSAFEKSHKSFISKDSSTSRKKFFRKSDKGGRKSLRGGTSLEKSHKSFANSDSNTSRKKFFRKSDTGDIKLFKGGASLEKSNRSLFSSASSTSRKKFFRKSDKGDGKPFSGSTSLEKSNRSFLSSDPSTSRKKFFRKSDKGDRKPFSGSTSSEKNNIRLFRKSGEDPEIEAATRMYRRSSSKSKGNQKLVNVRTSIDKDEHLETEPGLKPIESMNSSQMKQELESYFIPTGTLFEKNEMAKALLQARQNLLCSPPSCYPDSSFPMMDGCPSRDNREKRIQQAEASYTKLKVRELKQMLEASGLSASSFLEKRDMVHALAVARVDSAKQGEEHGFRETTGSMGSSFDSIAPPHHWEFT